MLLPGRCGGLKGTARISVLLDELLKKSVWVPNLLKGSFNPPVLLLGKQQFDLSSG